MTNILPAIKDGHAVTPDIAGGDYARNRADFLRATEQRHRNTPVFDPNDVPRGYRAHIGGGVWMKRCKHCDDYILSYGSIVYLWQMAEHEATHGGDVPGYNTPIF